MPQTQIEKLRVVLQGIEQLRVVLQGVEARASEREWLRLQTHGELDEARLVDGAAGDHLIYRRRGAKPPDPGAPQIKPKRLRFVLDVSGSMYRFNSEDRRLERCCQMAVLLMECLAGFDHKYSWSLVGHSGDGPVLKLVDYGKPPTDEHERLKVIQRMWAHAQYCIGVIQRMWAHAQYCMSGDCTLEATAHAIKEVPSYDVSIPPLCGYCMSGDCTLEATAHAIKKVASEEADDSFVFVASEEADDYFVFVLSDANLRRYGIEPEELGDLLISDKKVKAYAFFLAGGSEATSLAAALPLGRGRVCADPGKLPGAFKEVFAAASAMRLPEQ
ncbi:hypothetical protein T484DRAFT_1802869 [Baffinella frigidus]|nr:hypothetical protein T484DRAFT_1802869 [Cryptophyta sp. CCMP2293]